MNQAYIVAGNRTPIGSFCGKLKDHSAKELAKLVMQDLLHRTELSPEVVEEIIVGNVAQPTDAPNLGRVAALELGFPKEIPAYMVSRNCASGLQALVSGVQAIGAGDIDTALIVGAENMSQMPYLLKRAREGYRLRHGTLVDSMWEMLKDPVVGLMMGETAEIVAEEEGISREAQDLFALESHQKALAAERSGFYDSFRVAVPLRDRRGEPAGELSADEGPNPALTLTHLAALPPAFKEGGSVTAGNACSTNDGAAGLILMSEGALKQHQLKPLARVVSYAFVGLEPERMGLGPVYATQAALAKAVLSKEEIDLFEINEAFAAQALASIQRLELDPGKVNRYGGAIAVGHPVGATGVRLVVQLVHALRREQKKYGVAALCIGGGLGGAVVLENVAL